MSSIRVKNEKCHFCGKSVYAMDKQAADNIVFHKGCMKCEHCGSTLSLGNFAGLNGKYYCKPHFKQLFQTKGNYSDGFGEDKPTSKWEAAGQVYASCTPGADFTKPKGSSPLVTKAPGSSPHDYEPAHVSDPVHQDHVHEEPAPVHIPEAIPVHVPEPVSVHVPEPVQVHVPEPIPVHVPEPEPVHLEVPTVVVHEPEPAHHEPVHHEPEPEPASLSERMSNFTVDNQKPASPAVSHSPASSPGIVSVKKDGCVVCGKTVYTMEKMVADGKLFHKNCMKCTHCSKVLGLGNFAALNGKYYCKPHFKQLFQAKGNYSDGFGEELPTAKWEPQAPGYATGQKKFF